MQNCKSCNLNGRYHWLECPSKLNPEYYNKDEDKVFRYPCVLCYLKSICGQGCEPYNSYMESYNDHNDKTSKLDLKKREKNEM